MGWHYILQLECDILPEYIDFIKNEYLTKYQLEDSYYGRKKELPDENTPLSKSYRDLIDRWIYLDIGHHWYEYKLIDNKFVCEIQKRPNKHPGDLWKDYLTLVKSIFVPISSTITKCTIESDDYDFFSESYTDSELRQLHLSLNNLIESIHHVIVNNQIVESRIVYNTPLPESYQANLSQCYRKY